MNDRDGFDDKLEASAGPTDSALPRPIFGLLPISVLVWALPLAAGLIFAFAFFQAFLFRNVMVTQCLTLVSVVVWILGIATAILCFVRRSGRLGSMGLFISLLAVPLIPLLLLLAVSPEERGEFAENSVGAMQEIALLFDRGTSDLAQVDDIVIQWSAANPDTAGSAIQLNEAFQAFPVLGIPVHKVVWSANGDQAFVLISGIGPGKGYRRFVGFDVNNARPFGDVSITDKAHVSVSKNALNESLREHAAKF